MQQITLPTIFLPGTQCDERIWMPVWKLLNCANRSYVPLQWAESLEQMQALTQDRIDSFTGKVNLVGYSMGGYLACLVAKANPDKINALTLIGYDPNGLGKQELSNRKLLIKSIASGQKVPFNRARLEKYLSKDELEQKHIVNVMQDMDKDLGASVLRAHIQATTPRENLCGALSTFRFPIHFLYSKQDQIASSSNIEKLASTLPTSTQTIIPNTEHMMPISQPEAVAQALGHLLAS